MLLPILQTHNVSGKVLRYRTSPSWHTVCAVNRQLHFRAQIKTNSNCPQNNPSCLHRKHFGGGGRCTSFQGPFRNGPAPRQLLDSEHCTPSTTCTAAHGFPPRSALGRSWGNHEGERGEYGGGVIAANTLLSRAEAFQPEDHPGSKPSHPNRQPIPRVNRSQQVFL